MKWLRRISNTCINGARVEQDWKVFIVSICNGNGDKINEQIIGGIS